MRHRAVLLWDFYADGWVAEFEGVVDSPSGFGDSPKEAVVALEYQADKHGWPE